MSKVDKVSFCHYCLIPKPCCDYYPLCYGKLSVPNYCIPCLYMSPKKLLKTYITNCGDKIDVTQLPYNVVSVTNGTGEVETENCVICCSLMCFPIKFIVFCPCIPCICYNPPWEYK